MKFTASLLATLLLTPLMAIAQEKVPETPRPEIHAFRVIYTLTEMDAGKKVSVQKTSMVLDSGPRPSTIKLGSRTPIVTGSYSTTESSKIQTQFTYLDVGLNISASLRELPNGFEVLSKVEQSSIADAPPALPQDPVIRQTMLENSSMLTLGKPLLIGSLDIPGSTRHTDIEILLERIP